MRPILFNTEMVRAILEGRKTATRRVIKPQPRFIYANDNFGPLMQITKPHKGVWFKGDPNHVAPYRVGDILYVRETWAYPSEAEIAAGADPGMFLYKAERVHPAAWGKWCPSIHMPKEAARLFLRVTDVLVERVQDIAEDQAIKEGARSTFGFVTDPENEYAPSPHSAREDFRNIWDSTVQPKDQATYGWAANPWVWVIEFERISREAAYASEWADRGAAMEVLQSAT